MKKNLNKIGLVIGALTGLAGVGYYLFFRRPLPHQSGRHKTKGLKAPVEILRDHLGIPHIYAENIEDLMSAQGYAHAQDRLWQMDFQRRLVCGRVAEIFGEVALPLDRWMRILGMYRVARDQIDLLETDTLASLKAYARGVNARIEECVSQKTLPVEFNLLRYRPEPWSIVDSLSWSKMMAWNLSVNWETEILRAQLIARIGLEKAAELEPEYFADWPTIIPPGTDYSALGSGALKRAAIARQTSGPGPESGLGSNNWVISGERTTTGKPILANDMHLGLSIPAIWVENHLVCGDLNINGITFPGIPYIISGHNQYVAWGFTNGFPDVQDLYMEHLEKKEDGRVLVEYQGEWSEAQVIKELIRVKGGDSKVEEVVITRHGPIINSLLPDEPPEQPLALRWTALEPDKMFDGLYGMMRARNCLEFRESLRLWSVPIQNTVYADTEGNIAYSYPGKVPIRTKGDGRVPVPGWTGEYEWTGYIPYEELPHLFNPPQGFIASANNRVVDAKYPHFLGYDHVSGNRAERIVQMIESREKIGLTYIQQMQFDQVSTAAQAISRLISRLDTSDPELQIVIQRMSAWDGHLKQNSPEAAVYEVFVLRMIHKLLAPRLGELAIRYAGKGPTPILAEFSLFGDRAREWLRKTLENPASPWFDLGGGENREAMIAQTLRETVDELKSKMGPGIHDWSWGKIHKITFTHTLGVNPALKKLFNRGPIPVGGDPDTIWNTDSSRVDLERQQMIGPAFRFIADLSNLENSLGLLAPGQSGHPASKHYDDQLEAWFKGGYHPMLSDREKIVKGVVSTLRLVPS